jgi:hypothetical protein
MALLLLEFDTELSAREWLDHFEVAADNLLIRGEQNDLVGCGRKVSLHNVAAVMGIQAAKRRVDDQWNGASRDFGQRP